MSEISAKPIAVLAVVALALLVATVDASLLAGVAQLLSRLAATIPTP